MERSSWVSPNAAHTARRWRLKAKRHVGCHLPHLSSWSSASDVSRHVSAALSSHPGSSSRHGGKEGRANLIIDSYGGQADVAIRINDVLREVGRDVQVLVPRNAFSAATMLALGGTKIVMHPLACLGPIDPQLVFRRPDGTMEVISAEDIKAFVEFIREEVGITHQKEVASVFGRMYDDVKPVQLGVARRASMRSIALAKELLERHASSGEEKMENRFDRRSDWPAATTLMVIRSPPRLRRTWGSRSRSPRATPPKHFGPWLKMRTWSSIVTSRSIPQGWILTEWERRLKEWTTALQTPTPPATALSAKEMIQAELNAAQLNARNANSTHRRCHDGAH